MRAFALPLCALLVAAPAARAADAPTVSLAVGEVSKPYGILTRCDDLGVVAVEPDGRLRGLKPGATICSFDTSGGAGIRAIYEIQVHAVAPKEGPGGKDAKAPPRG